LSRAAADRLSRGLRRIAVVAAAAVLLAAAAGWGAQGRAAGPRPAAAPGPVRWPVLATIELVRAAALGNGRQRVLVRPDGQWLYLPDRGSQYMGGLISGRFSLADRTRLAALTRIRPPAAPPSPCPAGYRYELTVGSVSTLWTDCSLAGRPAEIVALVRAATPL
jgi:hypothetical protein